MRVLTYCERPLQVSQYASRAEELKALVASDNREHFEEARTARDVLRGRAPYGERPLALSSSHPGATALEPALCARFNE